MNRFLKMTYLQSLPCRICIFTIILLCPAGLSAQFKVEEPLYGVAYYYEYMPVERLDKDVQMMKECGINVVRICESTWGYLEPQDGEFNFGWLDRVLNAMHSAGIKVIIGTPTYSLPTWLAKQYPEILAETKQGKNRYGSRQNMDITHPSYLFYAERIIRALVSHVSNHPAVIGYQLDNETKHYNTSGANVQMAFQKYLKDKFKSLDSLNLAFGLHYWSNSVNSWEDLPSTLGTVNASLGCEFSRFQRKLVTDFLAWQAGIVNSLKRPNQFITQNFDLDWRNGSYAWQTDVDHFEAARALDIAGIDIYHPTQENLTGIEIAIGGDVARSMKQQNYLVMETQAQSIINSQLQELPYPGQLRLQAFSHFASGANMVAYWPWHSIHNSAETYWKGLLSHDMQTNPTYEEAKTIASDLKRIGSHIINLEKKNKVAILASNESISALMWHGFSFTMNYNDVLRKLYESLYRMNVECDFVTPGSLDLEKYSLLIVPPLYVASDSLLEKLNRFAFDGGHILYAFKSGFCNENVQVRMDMMPAVLREATGFYYQQFTNTRGIGLKDNPFKVDPDKNLVSEWAELLVPEKASVLAWYDHTYWGKYAAITQNKYGKGVVTYFGAMPSDEVLYKLVQMVVKTAGLWKAEQAFSFPVIIRNGTNSAGKKIHYLLNYSSTPVELDYPYEKGKDLLSGIETWKNLKIKLGAWDFKIIEEY
jgi:beta-galactosidase